MGSGFAGEFHRRYDSCSFAKFAVQVFSAWTFEQDELIRFPSGAGCLSLSGAGRTQPPPRRGRSPRPLETEISVNTGETTMPPWLLRLTRVPSTSGCLKFVPCQRVSHRASRRRVEKHNYLLRKEMSRQEIQAALVLRGGENFELATSSPRSRPHRTHHSQHPQQSPAKTSSHAKGRALLETFHQTS
jgi:hypothetical protein